MRFTVESLPYESAHEGLAVLHPNHLAQMSCTPGDVIQLRGRRPTVARLSVSEEVREGFIQLDATTRLNTGAAIQETVEVDIAQLNGLNSAKIAVVGDSPIDNITAKLDGRLAGRAVCQGDHITLPIAGGILEIQIEKCRPKKGGLVPSTKATISSRAAKKPLARTAAISFADIGGLKEVIARIQEAAVI